MLSAAELYQRGVAANAAGRFASARRSLELATTRTDDSDLLSRIDLSLAYVEAETGDPDAALRLCARATARAGLTATTRGVAASQRALLLARRGSTAAAEEEFATAAKLLGGDPELSGRVHVNRGVMRLQNGQPAAARLDFARGRELFDEAGNDLNRDKAGYNVGCTELLLGDLVTALRIIDDLGPRLAELGPVYQAMYQSDRAEVLIAAGLVSEGQAALAAAAQAHAQRGLRQFQGEVELALARSLLLTDPADAVRRARQAARRFRARGSESWALRADVVEVMGRVADGARDDRLLARTRDLVVALSEQGLVREEKVTRMHVARLHIRRGELGEAAAVLATVTLKPDESVTTRLLHRELRADLARARGHVSRSLGHVRRGLAELHAWQSSFGSLDLQANLVGHGRQLAVDGLRMAVANGSAELVLEWSERARTLVSRVTPVRPPSDERVVAELAELRALLGQAPPSGTPEARRLGELREAIRHHSWFVGTGSEVVEPVELSALQAGLADADAALVAYLMVQDKITAVVVTPSFAKVVDLGPQREIEAVLAGLGADLDMAAGDLPAGLRTAVVGSLQTRLGRLAETLVGPLLPLVDDRRLVLTPSGSLAGTPWTLLPGLAGRPLTIPQSATRWLSAPAHVSDPARTVGLVAGPRVERAAEEVTRAAACWPSATVLTGASATCSAVNRLAEDAQLLHVSAHGRHAPDNPLFSSLVLADGDWFGYDIDSVVAVPDTVVLSACELGRSSVRAGEEMVGMSAAWLHAGATHVIAAIGLLRDEVACEVLADLHQRLAAGAAPADALAAASEAARSLGPAPLVSFGRGF